MMSRRRLHPGLWLGLLAAMAVTYRPVFQAQVIAGRDVFRLFIPNAAFLRQCLLALRLPLWNPYVRLGEPFVATLQSQAFYPPNLIAVLLVGPTWTPTVLQLFHVTLGAWGMFLACRRLGRTVAASALGAAVLSLSPFFAQASLMQNIAGALAWGGFVLLAAQAVARRPALRSAALLALPLALSALCGAPEITLCEALIALVLAGGPRRALGFAALGSGWAVALAAVALLPTAELALHSIRTFHSTGLPWSTSFPQLLSAVLPFSDVPRGAYWGGDQVLFLSLFLGGTTGALALLALRRERRRTALALLVVLFALLCLGEHFAPARFLLTHPPLAIFRYPAKFFAGCVLCLAPLAAFGFDRLGALARRRGPAPRRVPWALGAWLVLFAVGFVALRHLPIRFGIALGFAWGMGVAFLLGLAFLLLPSGERRAPRMRAVAAGLLFVELAAFSLGFPLQSWADAKALDRPSSTAAALGALGGDRVSVVLSVTPHPGSAVNPHAYVNAARDGLVLLQGMRERLSTVEGYGPPEPERLHAFEGGAPQPLYDLLGVRAYVREEMAPFAGLQAVHTVPGVSRTFVGGRPMPRAFVVYRSAQVEEDAAEKAVTDPSEPFRTTAFLEGGPPLPGSARCQGFTPAHAREELDRVEVKLDACDEGVLVLTDRFYPGWEATLDGRPVSLFRADWLGRGVKVPAGKHRVVMRYRPASFRLGGWLSLFALAGVAFALGRRGR